MKRFKVFALGLVAVLALGMLTGCGDVADPTEEQVLDALIEEDVYSKDETKADGFELVMGDIEINEDKDKADVECSVSIIDGSLKYTTEYEVKFKMGDEKEWEVRKVESGDTKTELAAGITDDELIDLLEWKSVEMDGDYFYLDGEDAVFEVGEHDTDLKEKKDVVTITGTATSTFMTYTFTAEVTCTYDYGWYADSCEVVEYAADYVDGYEFTKTADDVIADLKADDEYIYATGYYYYFTTSTLAISNATLGELEYSGYYLDVPITFTMTLDDVVIDVEATVVYYYDDDDAAWDYDYMYGDTVVGYTCDAIGTWNGTDTDSGSTITLVISETLTDDEYLSATITVKTSNGITYSYSAYLYDYEPDGSMTVSYDSWIERPTDTSIYMDSFYGIINNGVFAPEYSWYSWSFTKAV